MKAHELAQKLLAGPDLPVVLTIRCANDSISSTDEDGNPGPNEIADEIDVDVDDKTVTIGVHMFDSNFGWLD